MEASVSRKVDILPLEQRRGDGPNNSRAGRNSSCAEITSSRSNVWLLFTNWEKKIHLFVVICYDVILSIF